MVGIVVVADNKKLLDNIIGFATYMAPKVKFSRLYDFEGEKTLIVQKKLEKCIKKVMDKDDVLILVDKQNKVQFDTGMLEKLTCNYRAEMVFCELMECVSVAAMKSQEGFNVDYIIDEVVSTKLTV